MDNEFETLRREPDPVRRGRRATELLAAYQQRSVELARLRRAAIEEAREQLGGSYTEVARAFGLTKGRIAQIRSGAPPAHRAFFGVGPLDVALPGRQILARDDLVIAAEDDAVGVHLITEAERLAFLTERRIIDPREEWEPDRDSVVVCGPASAHVGQALMALDPFITMRLGDGPRWYIVDKTDDTLYPSPLDDPSEPRRADVAYIARHQRDGQVVVHIAGLHALGSVAAAHYVTEHLADLWGKFGERSFSMAISAEFDGLTPIAPTVIIPPREWDE
ncbi:helix-turn-helix transcriptional regulator [Actinomycetes bacterium KLBMP 9759]